MFPSWSDFACFVSKNYLCNLWPQARIITLMFIYDSFGLILAYGVITESRLIIFIKVHFFWLVSPLWVCCFGVKVSLCSPDWPDICCLEAGLKLVRLIHYLCFLTLGTCHTSLTSVMFWYIISFFILCSPDLACTKTFNVYSLMIWFHCIW